MARNVPVREKPRAVDTQPSQEGGIDLVGTQPSQEGGVGSVSELDSQIEEMNARLVAERARDTARALVREDTRVHFPPVPVPPAAPRPDEPSVRTFRVLNAVRIVYGGGVMTTRAGTVLTEVSSDIDYLRRQGVQFEEITKAANG